MTAGEVQRGIVPAAAGLSVDYEASVAAAGAQRSWSPAWLWDYYDGGDDLDAVVAVDTQVRETFLTELAAETRTPAREGAVRLTPTGVKVTDPATGEELDSTAAAAELEAAFLSASADRPSAVVLPMVTMRPDIDASDVEAAVRDFANPAMSAPVTLRFGSASARLTPGEYAGAIALEPQGGVLVPVLRPDKARPAAQCAGGRRRRRCRCDRATRRREPPGHPGEARRDLRARGRAQHLPRPGHQAAG